MSSPTARISVIDMAMRIAETCALRSEDPWTKVGAVGLTSDNRIVATAYNGLLPGFKMNELWKHLNVPEITLEKDCIGREWRLNYMLHAEQNLCSLVRRGELHCVCVTHRPCPSCLLLLATHGVGEIYYLEEYGRDVNGHAHGIAKFYNLNLQKYVPPQT